MLHCTPADQAGGDLLAIVLMLGRFNPMRHTFFGSLILVPKNVCAGFMRRRVGDSVAWCVVKPTIFGSEFKSSRPDFKQQRLFADLRRGAVFRLAPMLCINSP